jgi:hypothetical protein
LWRASGALEYAQEQLGSAPKGTAARSAVSGKFVTKAAAKANPRETVRERY